MSRPPKLETAVLDLSSPEAASVTSVTVDESPVVIEGLREQTMELDRCLTSYEEKKFYNKRNKYLA